MSTSSSPSPQSAEPHLAQIKTAINNVIDTHADDLVAFRRDLHAHPELSWLEQRTTERVADRVSAAGWDVELLPNSGLIANLGDAGPWVGLRADLDALPVADTTPDDFASTVEGVAHACGHDVHTTGVVGSALALAELHKRGQLPGRVRLLFQPAEEVMPGGALQVMGAGGLSDLDYVYAVHCDPSLDVGVVGLREGPLTGAADALDVRVFGKGGHTSRPHLTQDLTFALAKLVTELPAILSRKMDPRAGVSVVWGQLAAGAAPNVIPSSGVLKGTIRMLDQVAWVEAETLVRDLAVQILQPYGITADITYHRGVPPVVNEPKATTMFAEAVDTMLGPDRRVMTSQSLGGEDFGWFLEEVPGAMARLGTRTPGGPTYDLHMGDLRVDERATLIGARVLAQTACVTLSSLAG